jgi:hypothetical protein
VPSSAEFWRALEKYTDLAVWKASKVDVVLNHALFNLVDQILESLIKML